VLNLDLMKQLDEAIAGRRYEFRWVKGHVGHELNEAADTRARGAATAYQTGSAVPSGPGWGGRVIDAAPAPAPGASTAPPAGSAVAPAEVEEDEPEREPSLFELDEPATVEIALSLTPEEHARLTERARRLGITPVEALRALI